MDRLGGGGPHHRSLKLVLTRSSTLALMGDMARRICVGRKMLKMGCTHVEFAFRGALETTHTFNFVSRAAGTVLTSEILPRIDRRHVPGTANACATTCLSPLEVQRCCNASYACMHSRSEH